MKVIVFGGSGFLGSHVADALSDQGMDVVIYDCNPSEYLRKDQRMIVGDVLDAEKVLSAVKGADYVYNFSGIAGIEDAAEIPLETVKVNVLGNTNILDACRKNRVQRCVFASTLYVYSQLGSFYRASKQSCEVIIEAYAEKFNLDFTILRYGSLYGPRADRSNWICKVLTQALEEKKVTRAGDGKELREYIHVEDAARLSVEILKSEFKNDYVIIAGQQNIEVGNLMIMIKEMLNNEIELEYVDGGNDSHYEITPYSFKPRRAKRISSSSYVDLGQGLLELLDQIHEKQKVQI